MQSARLANDDDIAGHDGFDNGNYDNDDDFQDAATCASDVRSLVFVDETTGADQGARSAFPDHHSFAKGAYAQAEGVRALRSLFHPMQQAYPSFHTRLLVIEEMLGIQTPSVIMRNLVHLFLTRLYTLALGSAEPIFRARANALQLFNRLRASHAMQVQYVICMCFSEAQAFYERTIQRIQACCKHVESMTPQGVFAGGHAAMNNAPSQLNLSCALPVLSRTYFAEKKYKDNWLMFARGVVGMHALTFVTGSGYAHPATSLSSSPPPPMQPPPPPPPPPPMPSELARATALAVAPAGPSADEEAGPSDGGNAPTHLVVVVSQQQHTN